MNPELLEYARTLGLYLDPPPASPSTPKRSKRVASKPRKSGPKPPPKPRGRPRLCDHTDRYPRKDGKGTYCRACRRVQERERYHRLNPGARHYKEKTA